MASTVQDPGGSGTTILPFGFVQSQILAAICLSMSALGTCLTRLSRDRRLKLSVYVDDIIVSSSIESALSEALATLETAAAKAKFSLNLRKQEGPALAITAFNILLSNESMEIAADRYRQFEDALNESTSAAQREGVISYVRSVNSEQAAAMLTLL